MPNELPGRKSEKRFLEDNRQLPIFKPDRADQGDPETADAVDDIVVVPARIHLRRGRKRLPENLPRVDGIHDLFEEEKVFQCGEPSSRIGQDICEKLDYVPAKFQVLHHIRCKYVCKSSEGVENDGPMVKIAPTPVLPIEKSMANERFFCLRRHRHGLGNR